VRRLGEMRDGPPAARFLSVRHRGVTAAWNAGITVAETDFVVLVNNDVIWQGAALDTLLQPLREQTAVACGVAWRREREWPTSLMDSVPAQPLLAGWCWAFSRTTWRTLRGFDSSLALWFSDTDFQLRLLQHAAGTVTGHGPLAVRSVPLLHGLHQTTLQLPDRRELWERDRRRFLEKWR
jgi:Glycosyl transferase family 2